MVAPRELSERGDGWGHFSLDRPLPTRPPLEAAEVEYLARVPHAVQRAYGAPQMRDRQGTCFDDPGSAAHHFMLRRARETIEGYTTAFWFTPTTFQPCPTPGPS